MAFSADYDMIQINTAKNFAVLFFDEISGTFYDPLNVEIEIGQFCNNVFVRILKDPMVQVDIGNYTYSTLITPNVYPVNQLFFVYFTGTHPISGDPILRIDKFRTLGAPIMPQATNVANYLINPISNSNSTFNKGLSI